MESNPYKCPVCNSNELMLRHEASYIYSYVLDSDKPGLLNSEKFLSYDYDIREQKDSHKYIECQSCKSRFPDTFLDHITNTKP